MERQSMIKHAPMQVAPVRLVMDVAPHVHPQGGTSPVLVNLIKSTPEYRGCFLCGGDPLYTVVWDTPGAWWGDTHREDYCAGCAAKWGRPQGVSLAKGGDPAPAPRPALSKTIRLHGGEEGNGGWYQDISRASLKPDIRAALRLGQYHYASDLSAMYHRP